MAVRDASAPEDVPAENPLAHPGITLVCLSCLLGDHPEIGRGLHIARENQVADLDDDGEWIVGDVSRLGAD